MKQPAKKLTLAILVIAFLVGLVGCFLAFFDMVVSCSLPSLYRLMQPFFLGMVASVGTGSVVSKIQEGKRDRKTDI